MKNIILAISLVFVIFLIMFIDVSSNNDDGELTYLEAREAFFAEHPEIQRILEMEAPIREAYNRLMESFMDNYGNRILPDNYAGSFFRSEVVYPRSDQVHHFKQLIVHLTEVDNESIAFYKDIMGHDAPVTFREVNFSYNQLRSFGEIFAEAIDTSVPITFITVDVVNNKAKIGLYKDSINSIHVIDRFNTYSEFFPIPITFELSDFPEILLLEEYYF